MIYLDNAATTLRKPDAVVQAVAQAMCCAGNAGRGAHDAAMDASRIMYDTRVLLAQLFGAEKPERIAFTMNSTESLNIALRGVLEPGDHVITTALEHNSVLRPLYALEKQGVRLTILPADRLGRLNYDDFGAAICADTKAIVCTHASNLTGNLVDIARVGRIAAGRGLLFIVDASQTAGAFPIDVKAMHIDILCFTGHKSLLGPQGTGGLYVREGVKLRPLIVGGSGIQSYSREHPVQMPEALEAGTQNVHGLAGLRAALEYLRAAGQAEIRRTEQALMRSFYRDVRCIPGVTVYGDFSAEERCPIVALNLRDYDSARVSDELFTRYGISTRPGAHCAPLMHRALGTAEQGAVRFSFSHLNTMDEASAAVRALRGLAEE